MKYKVKCSICQEYTIVNRFPGKGTDKIKCEECKENGKRNKNSIERSEVK